MKTYTSNFWAYLGLVAAMILWASSFVALKLAFRGYDPMVVIFGRMFVASLCFLPLLPRFWAGNSFRRRDLKPLLFMAFCEPCLYFIFEARALELTTASQAGMITALLPLMVALAARVVLKEVFTPSMLTGFGVAIIGAGWLSLAGEASAEAPQPLLGNFMEFLAMVCATGYIISLKRLTCRYTPFFLTAIQAFVGAVFFFPALWLPSTTWPTHMVWGPTLAIVYLGAIITLGAYGLYNYGVSRIPASQASIFINLIPVFTVILGWLILNERFTKAQYMASTLVFLGIYLSQRSSPSAKAST
ncbi:MAG: DMT family transporter [Desulfosarcina sp.]|nr:DMT family transporter [Desulfobacterales bacterium]